MIDIDNLIETIEPELTEDKVQRVLSNYRYNSLSTYNKFQYLLAQLPEKKRKKFLDEMDPYHLLTLTKNWQCRARPDQLEPSEYWRTWIYCAGRSSGKSMCGLQWMADQVMQYPGEHLIVGSTDSNVRKKQLRPLLNLLRARGVKMGRGAIDMRDGTVTLPNGSYIYSGSGTTIHENVRGYNLSTAWIDELGSFADPIAVENQVRYALRIAPNKMLLTTTPRVDGMANTLMKTLLKKQGTVYTTTNSYANLDNLDPAFIGSLLAKEGTRVGEEECWSELLDDSGALWNHNLLSGEYFHFDSDYRPDHFEQIVIAWDPAISNNFDSDEHGIIVVGVRHNITPHQNVSTECFYVLEDQSGKYGSMAACNIVSNLYKKWMANAVVAEVNNGGDFIGTLLQQVDPNIYVKSVKATRGKLLRAEPVLGVYEQHRVKHARSLGKLEQEMINFSPTMKKSPNRVDALVYGITYFLKDQTVDPAPLDVYLGF